MDRVAGVTEVLQVCERRLDVRAGVALFDFYEHRRPQPAQRRLATAKHGELVSLHIALDEVDALESEVVESAPLDLNRSVGAGGLSEACEAVGGSIADHRDVQRGAARFVGQCEWMDVNIPGRTRDRVQRLGVLTIRFEGVDEAGGADDPGQQGCVSPPPRPDVKCSIARPHELLCYARGEVALQPLSL